MINLCIYFLGLDLFFNLFLGKMMNLYIYFNDFIFLIVLKFIIEKEFCEICFVYIYLYFRY